MKYIQLQHLSTNHDYKNKTKYIQIKQPYFFSMLLGTKKHFQFDFKIPLSIYMTYTDFKLLDISSSIIKVNFFNYI